MTAATLNQFLLEGAREHDRDGVFADWNGERWVPMPDWRADRHAIRIALVLRERFGVEPGDTVCLSLELRLEWALIERAVWGLGAISRPVLAPRDLAESKPVVVFTQSALEDPPAGCRAVVDMDADYDELLDYGGVLDTPERATQFRARARQTPPEALASIESGQELSHAAWMAGIARFHEQNPPERGRTQVIATNRPERAARTALYAGWGGGLVRSAIAAPGGTHPDGFVTLSLEGINDHG